MEIKQKKKSRLDRFAIWLLAILRNSLIGRFLTSYDKANEKFFNKAKRKGHKSVRRLARFIEKSRVINAVPKLTGCLLRIPLRDYGIMMFMTGAVVTVLYPLNGMITFINVSFEMFISGAAACVCSLPLLFSSKSLARNVLASRFFSTILFGFFGLDDEGFRQAAEKNKLNFASFAFVIGAGLGVSAYFIMPSAVLLLIVAVVLAYCIARTPEVGVMVSILLIPFVNMYVVYGCVAFTFLCYIVKVRMGKRIFKFEYFDLWVCITLAAMLFCGINYKNPLSTLKETLLSLVIMLSYFLFANLIYSKVWFRRSIVAFTLSSLVVALVAVIQAIIRSISTSVPSLGNLVGPEDSIVSSLGSSTVLAQFMIIAIPFAFVHMISERKDITKFGGFIMAAILITALVLADSAVGLIGLLVGALLVFAFFNRKAIYIIAIVIIVLPVLYFTLPENALSFIASVGPLDGVSVKDGFVAFKDNFLTVIKRPLGANLYGESVFDAYGAFSFDSLLLQLLSYYGIIGTLAFFIMGIMFVRMSLSYSVKAKNEYRRVNGCAGLCSVVALSTVGIFNDVWADKRVFLLFVITLALSVAYIRIEKEEEAASVRNVDISVATIDIPLKEVYAGATVSKIRYVHAPKVKKHLRKQNKLKVAEAKEFSNTDELIISKRNYRSEQEEN